MALRGKTTTTNGEKKKKKAGPRATEDKFESANRQEWERERWTRGTQSSDENSMRWKTNMIISQTRRRKDELSVESGVKLLNSLNIVHSLSFALGKSLLIQSVHLFEWWNTFPFHVIDIVIHSSSAEVFCAQNWFSLCFLHFIYMSFQGESHSHHTAATCSLSLKYTSWYHLHTRYISTWKRLSVKAEKSTVFMKQLLEFSLEPCAIFSVF